MNGGNLSGGFDFFPIDRTLRPERDILRDRPSEKEGLLIDDGDLAAQITARDARQIDAVEADLALLTIIIPEQKVEQRRFPRSGQSKDADRLTRFDGKRDIF